MNLLIQHQIFGIIIEDYQFTPPLGSFVTQNLTTSNFQMYTSHVTKYMSILIDIFRKKILLIFIFDKLSCIYFDETLIGDVLIRQAMEELYAICRQVQNGKILNVDI